MNWKRLLPLPVALGLVFGTGCRGMPKYEIVTVPVPAGVKIVEKKTKVYAEEETIERSPNVKTVARLTDFKGDKHAYDPDVSPDGRWVAFEIREPERDGRGPVYNLWRVDTSGRQALTRLTDSVALNLRPAWSPDGELIYFSSNRIGNRLHLWTIHARQAGGITQLTSSTTLDFDPSVSPTGNKVAYEAEDPAGGRKEIWIVNSDGSFPTQIVEGRSPAWSPDGTRIAYVVWDRETGEEHIWTMRADGTERTQITFGEAGVEDVMDLFPCWSPDGRWIAFESNRGKDRKGRRNFDIWAVRPDASALTQLTTNGSYDSAPTWGPEGKYIYFQSNRGWSWDIWRMEIQIPH